jgi:hypothetical protein
VLSIRQAGKEICSVRDELSYRTQDNVLLNESYRSQMTANNCLQLAKSMTACCIDENECLDKIALFIDEEKTRNLYNEKSGHGSRPILWDGKKSQGRR